jgi:COP9 signalosome complex subunit 1
MHESLRFARDDKWVESVEKRAQQKLEKLEQELNTYKANLIKESIRMGHNDLGDFHYDCGSLNEALKCYIRTRDYCQTPKHILDMCLHVIKVSIEMSTYVHVTNHVTKGENTADASADPIILAKLKCAAALAHIENNKYKMAARKFLDTSFEMANNYTEVLVPEDIAVYGGLCALATFDRKDLKAKVIDNAQFKNFLELVPHLRELVNDFYCSRYASCLKYLADMRADLELDIHLHDHVEPLYEQIRCKALVQYFSPFISVDLNKMAAAFNTDLEALEAELAQLIMKDDIQARIDSHKKILVAQHADLRNQTFSKALQVGHDYVRDTKALILRINLMRNNFVGKAPKGSITEVAMQ